jgi:glycosyltransferase involved in cell wall biosynthesis
MASALISCILPVYNGERYLGEAIESILSQTYQSFEIIVVDDGSTDKTVEVVKSYGERLRYVRQANAGPAAARNHGIRLARGEFVAFQDADDVWHPEKLARQMARFAARSELELCSTQIQNFWIPELKEEAEHFHNHRLSQPLPGYVPQALLVRRALLDQVGLFNPALLVGDDTDWFLRAAEQGVVMEVLPDVLVYRRLHQANISRSSASRQFLLQAVKASLDRRRYRGDKVPRSLEFSALNRQEKV